MDSSNYTTDDILPVVAPQVLRDTLAIVVQSLLYGMYLILIGPSCCALLRKKQPTLASYILSAALVSIFSISTFLWASNLAIFVKRFNIAFVSTDGPILSRLDLADLSTEKIRYMSDVFFVISYLIGDAIIAWRLVILGGRSVWVSFVMAILWVAALGMGFGLIGCLAHANFAPPELLPQSCSTLENISWVFSLTLNGVSTLVLVRVARHHRRNVSQHISSIGRTSADFALTTLAISGIVYFLLGVPRLTAFANQTVNPFPSAFTYAAEIIEFMLYQIVGLYPTAVIAVLLYQPEALSDSKAESGPVRPRHAMEGLRMNDETSPDEGTSTSTIHFHGI